MPTKISMITAPTYEELPPKEYLKSWQYFLKCEEHPIHGKVFQDFEFQLKDYFIVIGAFRDARKIFGLSDRWVVPFRHSFVEYVIMDVKIQNMILRTPAWRRSFSGLHAILLENRLQARRRFGNKTTRHFAILFHEWINKKLIEVGLHSSFTKPV